MEKNRLDGAISVLASVRPSLEGIFNRERFARVEPENARDLSDGSCGNFVLERETVVFSKVVQVVNDARAQPI